MRHPILLLAFLSAMLLFGACSSPEKRSTTGTNDAIEQRVDSLLALMTLEEKIGQLTLYSSDFDVTGPTMRSGYLDDVKSGKVGAIFNAFTAAFTTKIQKLAIENTRLKIPLLFGYDVIHGFKTAFPVPLGEAASWDTALCARSARVAAVEAAAAGLHWTFAPMVDIARDPRWGRITEGAGEDPHLGSAIAAARVRGFQGINEGKTLAANDVVLACVKHFAAYGAAEAGRDYNTTDMSDRVLREIYLPPYKAAIDAGALSVMSAFNELNGVPATGNQYLLTDILRNEWKFKGFVVTDYTSINEMIPHNVVADSAEAGELAINAGVDMDMQGGIFQFQLAKLVKQGRVSESTINEAVRRVLRLKFMLGLFEAPYGRSDTTRERERTMTPEHLEVSLDAARKSIVLLKNDSLKGNAILPLASTIKTIAIVGPLADSKRDMLGAWAGACDGNKCISLLEGMKKRFPQANILYAKGCNINDDSTNAFNAALQAASKADVVIAALGETSEMSGEAASRSNIGIPGVQEDLLKKLATTGKPVVLVLMNGRPLAIPWAAQNIPAIVEAWFLGTRAGDAIAEVLAGDYNPSGKLPVTFPRSVGQIPLYYNHKNTGRPINPKDKYTSKYLDIQNTPQFAFGHGLSYTTFAYSALRLEKSSIKTSEQVRVSIDVQNTGTREGVETAQFYIRDLVASVPRPVQELRGFQKVVLKAGETKTLTFTLTPEDLMFYNRQMKRVVEPGDIKIMVGGSSDNTLTTTLKVTQ